METSMIKHPDFFHCENCDYNFNTVNQQLTKVDLTLKDICSKKIVMDCYKCPNCGLFLQVGEIRTEPN